VFQTPKVKFGGGSAGPQSPARPAEDVSGTEGLFANGFGHETLGGGQGMVREKRRRARIGAVDHVASDTDASVHPPHE
jgi:hypothetical protein